MRPGESRHRSHLSAENAGSRDKRWNKPPHRIQRTRISGTQWESAYRIEAQYPQALESFQKAEALDSEDADTHYFLGSVYLELHQPEQALTEFQAALRLRPTHASAQFGLAKVLQRLGKREEAATAFHRFETLNQEKIGSPLAHTYGDEGHYSLVQDALNLNPQVGPMIPVTFASQAIDHFTLPNPSQGGACLIGHWVNLPICW